MIGDEQQDDKRYAQLLAAPYVLHSINSGRLAIACPRRGHVHAHVRACIEACHMKGAMISCEWIRPHGRNEQPISCTLVVVIAARSCCELRSGLGHSACMHAHYVRTLALHAHSGGAVDA